MDSPKSIFFYYVPQGTPEDTAYQHNIVCLGEGLKALGIPFYSNVNYWKLSTSSNVQESIDRLIGEPGCLEKISIEGRQWARENYNSIATATRFIELASG